MSVKNKPKPHTSTKTPEKIFYSNYMDVFVCNYMHVNM